ncbi:MAG: ribosome silencing factor [Terriglobales bacterium]
MAKSSKPSRSPKRAPAARSSDARLRRALRAAVRAAEGKKAVDPVLLDLRRQADFCDYFLICHGNNPHQIEAIAEAIELRLKEQGLRPLQREGARQAEWVALDYMDFMVHIFTPRTRHFYDLERLWSGAPRVRLDTRSRERQA